MPRVGRPRRRGPLLPTLLVLALAVIAFLVFADFYTDWLWYKSIGFSNVYSTRLRAQIVLFLVFGLLTGGAVALNAWLAYRFRPPFRGLSAEQQSLERYRVSVEPYRRFITPILGIIIGLMAGSSASAHWRSWLMFRNSVPFGQKDPQFHMDVSFFAFRLPFWRYLLGFGFAIVLLSLVVTLAVHYLYGGIKIQTPGERLTPAARVHVSVLLGVFVLLKAVAYWLDRFALVLDQHKLGGNTASSITGATYTDVKAILPAKNILLAVALICAVLFFVNVWRKTWQLPALGPWPAGVLRRRHRWHLPGDHPVLQGASERADPRVAVHPAQHRCDQVRLRPRRCRQQALRAQQPDHAGGRERGAVGQAERTAARPSQGAGQLPEQAAEPRLLQLRRPAGHRPLSGCRQGARVGRRRPGAGPHEDQCHVTELGQPAHRLHARIRVRRCSRQRRTSRWHTVVLRAGRPAQGADPDLRAAGVLR